MVKVVARGAGKTEEERENKFNRARVELAISGFWDISESIPFLSDEDDTDASRCLRNQISQHSDSSYDEQSRAQVDVHTPDQHASKSGGVEYVTEELKDQNTWSETIDSLRNREIGIRKDSELWGNPYDPKLERPTNFYNQSGNFGRELQRQLSEVRFLFYEP